jgi:DNA-binding transcriptional LysR family regulator
LRYFVTLAETLHFGQAAERLHITQPPLTRQIAALEKDLGVQLLERGSRQARLTYAGRRLLEDARLAISTFDQACRNTKLAARGQLGSLSIGFMMHAVHTGLPRLTKRFMAQRPEVHVELREVTPDLLADAVLTGRFDAAIMFDPGAVKGLSMQQIFQEPLSLAVHSSHELAARSMIDARQLAGEPMIAVPSEVAPTLREAIVQYCRLGGFAPSFRLEAQLQQTIVSLVSENLGVALVPSSMRSLGLPDVVFRDLKRAPTVAHVIAWRPANQNPTLQPFLKAAGVRVP